MDERITKYDHLYKMMAEGRDPDKMHIFGHAERHMFREIVKRDPAMADARRNEGYRSVTKEREAVEPPLFV